MDLRAFECFKMEGEWLKGNLHSHTQNSDGDAAPEELAAWYERHGYAFLAITDHDVITDVEPLQRNCQMVLIPGIEFGYAPKEEPGWTLDMLGINMRKLPEFLDPEQTGRVQYDSSLSPQQIIDHINEIGGLAIMCHPYYMINMTEPYLKYQNYLGMEAYNYVCEDMCGRGHHEVYWDAMLYRGKKIWGFCTDDSHKADFGHAWIEVKAKERSVSAILEAIRNGHFYATSGPKIYDVEYTENNTVRISFDRPCDVALQPWPKGDYIHRHYENEMRIVDGRKRFFAEVAPELAHRGGQIYLRVELIDKDGNRAYTNPIYFCD